MAKQKKTRQDEHKSDQRKYGKHKQTANKVEPGACLTGHESGRKKAKPRYLKENSCNYRWQGYKQAVDEKSLYNNKAPAGQPVLQVRWGGLRRKTITPSKKSDWNVTPASLNFRTSCNVPYFHEAHHIVPHGELRDAINKVGPGKHKTKIRNLIRGGLLDELYNLNHKLNMIILPLDKNVAAKVGLPRHRVTTAVRSHKAYSKYIKGKLSEILVPVKKDEAEHFKEPDYEDLKDQIVNISETTRPDIEAAGGTSSLDQAAKQWAKAVAQAPTQ